MGTRRRATLQSAVQRNIQPPPAEKKQAFVPTFKALAVQPIVTFLPNGWGVAIMDIDPDLAIEMLQRNSEKQRAKKLMGIEKMAWDIVEDNWILTHQGLAFDDQGILFDGQNRLSAVIAAGKSAKMLVFFGVGHVEQTGEAKVIDTHSTRTPFDAATISGLAMSKRGIASVNGMIRYGMPNGAHVLRRMTNTLRIEIISQCKEAVEAVDSWIGKSAMAKKICNASVTAAIVCAYYHVDHERLKRFVEVLTEQAKPEKGDGAAVLLRQTVQLRIGTQTSGNDDIFLKACKSIQKFFARADEKYLYAAAENPFPPPLTDAIKDMLSSPS